ncbi:hypothetical protein FJNA_11220 [Thermus sp. FJN-A]
MRGVLLLLYLTLTLTASTGVALQMYLMRVQNPGLGADLCRAPGETEEVDHSLFCGMQVAPGLAFTAGPTPPTLLETLRLRPAPRPGYGLSLGQNPSPRAPPFAPA